RRLFTGGLARWFDLLSRGQVELTDHAAAISPGIAAHQVTAYYQNGRADFMSYAQRGGQLGEMKAPHGRAAGVLVWGRAWGTGPLLLGAFGMAGLETLAFCHWLWSERDDLICSSRFVMTEIQTAPCQRPATIGFDKWRFKPLGVAEPLRP